MRLRREEAYEPLVDNVMEIISDTLQNEGYSVRKSMSKDSTIVVTDTLTNELINVWIHYPSERR